MSPAEPSGPTYSQDYKTALKGFSEDTLVQQPAIREFG